jgi:hypothetical protein
MVNGKGEIQPMAHEHLAQETEGAATRAWELNYGETILVAYRTSSYSCRPPEFQASGAASSKRV